MTLSHGDNRALATEKFVKRDRTSAIVKKLADDCRGQDVRIATIIEALKDRSFGSLMILFALPNTVIPGISFILGAPIIFFALQLAAGRHGVWLPTFMRNRIISETLFQRIVLRVERFLIWMEKWTKPRWTWLVSGSMAKALGFYIAIVAGFLMMPVPFGNALPALGISFMSVGLIEKDGKAAAMGAVLGLAGAIYIVAAIVIGVKSVTALIGFL